MSFLPALEAGNLRLVELAAGLFLVVISAAATATPVAGLAAVAGALSFLLFFPDQCFQLRA